MNKPQPQPTPGPWVWNEQGELVSATAKEYEPIDEWDKPKPKRVVVTDGGHYPPHGADRCLIASAPDMLFLIVEYREKIETVAMSAGWYFGKEDLDAFDAVIQKATGTP